MCNANQLMDDLQDIYIISLMGISGATTCIFLLPFGILQLPLFVTQLQPCCKTNSGEINVVSYLPGTLYLAPRWGTDPWLCSKSIKSWSLDNHHTLYQSRNGYQYKLILKSVRKRSHSSFFLTKVMPIFYVGKYKSVLWVSLGLSKLGIHTKVTLVHILHGFTQIEWCVFVGYTLGMTGPHYEEIRNYSSMFDRIFLV